MAALSFPVRVRNAVVSVCEDMEMGRGIRIGGGRGLGM